MRNKQLIFPQLRIRSHLVLFLEGNQSLQLLSWIFLLSSSALNCDLTVDLLDDIENKVVTDKLAISFKGHFFVSTKYIIGTTINLCIKMESNRASNLQFIPRTETNYLASGCFLITSYFRFSNQTLSDSNVMSNKAAQCSVLI